jgi:hypothetical protein
MVETDVALEPKFGRLFGETCDGNAVTKDIVDPSHRAWRRIDVDPGFQQPLIEAVARPEHDAVLTEGDRLFVAVGGRVLDSEKRHLTWRSTR